MHNLEYIIKTLLAITAGSYFISFLLILLKKHNIANIIFIGAWLLNALIFTLNWSACGHPPFGNMYHVLIFLSLCFPPLYLVLKLRDQQDWLKVYFAFASVIPLMGSLFMDRDVFWRRMPALQSPWFVPHVFAYMVSYALATVAFSVLISRIIHHNANADKKAVMTVAIRQILRLAFPFMTFGMLSGALWAEEAWGVYWSWDSKETWSLITWTLYVIYFHCQFNPKLKKYADYAHLLAFLALITTFLLVNLLPKLGSGLHTYA